MRSALSDVYRTYSIIEPCKFSSRLAYFWFQNTCQKNDVLYGEGFGMDIADDLNAWFFDESGSEW